METGVVDRLAIGGPEHGRLLEFGGADADNQEQSARSPTSKRCTLPTVRQQTIHPADSYRSRRPGTNKDLESRPAATAQQMSDSGLLGVASVLVCGRPCGG